jgi:hypothetical protein
LAVGLDLGWGILALYLFVTLCGLRREKREG